MKTRANERILKMIEVDGIEAAQVKVIWAMSSIIDAAFPDEFDIALSYTDTLDKLSNVKK